MSKTVSIIIINYNGEQWIDEAITSALSQTYPHLEVIVIDDGSQDNSPQIIASFGDKITSATQPNQGANTARNHGFKLSQGDYVLFLDGDDWLESDTIAHMMNAAASYPNQIIACPWRYLQDGRTFPSGNPALKTDPILDEISARYTALHALLYPRQALIDVGGWDENLFASQDVDLKLRCLLNGYSMIHISHGMSYYRLHGNASISKSMSAKAVMSRLDVLKRAEQLLTEQGLLDSYREALSKAFHRLAGSIILEHPQIGAESLAHAERLFGQQSIDGTLSHRILCRVLGLRRKQQLSQMMRGWRARLSSRGRS